MKCIILLFAFVALCYSYPYGNTGGRNVNIGEDGTIVITGQTGKRVIITKGVGVSGQKTIDIAISGPNVPTKRIQINEQNELTKGVNLLESNRGQGGEFDVDDEYQRDKRSSKKRSQGDTLLDILKGYQGVVDDSAYEQLLKKVSTAVRSGLLSESVYDVLQNLNQGQYTGVGPFINTDQDVNIVDLLRRQQQMEELLQQSQMVQGSPFRVIGQQQIPQLYSSRQGIISGLGTGARDIGTTLQGQGVVLDVPVQTAQGQIMERILLAQPQGISYPRTEAGLIYGQKGIGGSSYGIPGISSRLGQRSIWEDLLSSNVYGQQWGIASGQYGQDRLSQIVENEKAILDQQSIIQQQQVQQQLQQQLQQQEQQQLLQQLQQLQQQQQLQQELQLQQQVWPQQVPQYNSLTPYQLLNRPVSTGTQQSRLWQQLVNQQGKLVGVPSWQGIPVTANNVPLVL